MSVQLNASANKFPLNEVRMAALEKKAKEGNFETVKHLLKGFAVETGNHLFLREHPELCLRFLPLMLQARDKQKQTKLGEQSSYLKEELINRVMKQFAKANVFASEKVTKEVEFKMASGEVVFMSREILLLTSEYFVTLFQSNFKEAKPNEQGKYEISVESDVKEPVLQAIKKYIYFQQLTDTLTPQEIFALSKLAGLYLMPELQASCLNLMKLAIDNCDVVKDFDTLIAYAQTLESHEALALQYQMIKKELTQRSIEFDVEYGETQKITIPVSKVSILELEGMYGKFIRSYIVGLKIDPENDVDFVSQIELIEEENRQRIHEIVVDNFDATRSTYSGKDGRCQMPPKIFKRLLHALPSLVSVKLSCDSKNCDDFLHAIASKESIKELHLKLSENAYTDFSTAYALFSQVTHLSFGGYCELKVTCYQHDKLYREKFEANLERAATHFREKELSSVRYEHSSYGSETLTFINKGCY